MKIKLFYHSLISDWNHGNAHFLRGIYTELLRKGHQVSVYENEKNWSLTNLLNNFGEEKAREFFNYFSHQKTIFYNPESFDPDKLLSDADLVIVHEWNDPWLVKKIGNHKKINQNYKLLFHDTHHRSVSAKSEMKKFDLSGYDGVLAYGETIRRIYIEEGWIKRAWTWHEAADTLTFHPMMKDKIEGDLVWIGNWGDEERTEELQEFIINPVKELGLKAKFYGVRYPEKALRSLEDAGIEYGGWLPNYKVPEIFSRYKMTVHVPRRPYTEQLPGIPTIRPFEAMSCKIPLICTPWNDWEKLFVNGKDYLMVQNSSEMKECMLKILNDELFAGNLTEHALTTIYQYHTCGHRVNELMQIYSELKSSDSINLSPTSTNTVYAKQAV